MKKPEWLFVAGLILVGAYFVYKYATKKNEFNPWELVPKNTSARIAPEVAVIMAIELEQDEVWIQNQIEEYISLTNNYLLN